MTGDGQHDSTSDAHGITAEAHASPADPHGSPADPHEAVRAMAADRVLAVVRAPRIPDPAALCAALAEGGIRTVEFTFTTPGVAKVLAAAAAAREPGRHLGAGTVLTAAQAAEAIDAGAEFLVTPAIRPEVAAVAAARGIPVLMGAFSPTEVAQAMDLGAAAVNIFPASALGPRYLKDLRGPYPDVRLVPSGGVSSDNARAFLDHGAMAVSCGTEVVAPAVVADCDYAQITRRAGHFTRAISRPS
ncbi:MAG TPA: bifunctional 4-hydroxy-2-oxoglutarate aldolase/2-dehydro-3-deoxy-phosphogluconate aldolase [Actinospica sp.]|nr:bifunctional 4-hydroxy-2-oxoglutarate aldolase/2-dehydro-3-deoxy-phosphogluconate aldolase [Actinospica sp.]